MYHTKQVYIQKYRPEVGVQGCDIARGPQAQGLYHIRGHPPKVYIFCILTGFSMLYMIYFIMMTAFLNGRYIYKNINPTTSKDDVIIMRYIMSSNCNGTSGHVNLMIFIGITIATAVQQWWIDRKLLYKAC